jgi:hypothetical protein
MKKLFLLLTLLSTLTFANTINFKKGWNFVGFNNTITLSTDTNFNNKDNIYVIWKYTNNTLMPQQGWSGYAPQKGMIKIGNTTYPEITTIQPSDGVWIYARKEFTYTLPSTSTTLTALPITSGWNLLSALDNNTINPASFTDTKIIWTYRSGAWLKKSFVDSDYSAYAQLTQINSNEAFWLYSSKESNDTTSQSSGSNSLVRVDDANSTQCSTGGVIIYTGLDTNKNNILDKIEQGEPQVVCNGTSSNTQIKDINITFPGAKIIGSVTASQGLSRKLSKKLYGYLGYNNRTLKLVPKGVSAMDKPKPYSDKIRANKHELLTNTFDIDVKNDGTFTVDDIPSGADYSLVYVDTTNNLGK